MNTATQRVINEIAADILSLAKAVFKDDKVSRNTKTGKNTLKKRAEDIKLEVDTNNAVIRLLFDDYLTYLENDRPPRKGKQPPLDELRDWALSKNIPTDNGTLFLIARAIWRDGHEGRPILATIEEQIEKRFKTEWYDKLFEATIDELNKYFN
ncbi:MAG: hypothetical protein LBU84_12280 [Prevotella sp.]|jgi:frataxin-like iron-binding protein CyaY|nr:hypothetical protein [Prevotella sp.]